VMHFIPKPFKVPDLIKIVKRIFERKVVNLELSALSVSHRR
jgi:DNA-binding NtrC family response regulator